MLQASPEATMNIVRWTYASRLNVFLMAITELRAHFLAKQHADSGKRNR